MTILVVSDVHGSVLWFCLCFHPCFHHSVTLQNFITKMAPDLRISLTKDVAYIFFIGKKKLDSPPVVFGLHVLLKELDSAHAAGTF